jgi:hypothetical protein
MVTPPEHQPKPPQRPAEEGKNEMYRVQALCQTKCKYVVIVMWEDGEAGGT